MVDNATMSASLSPAAGAMQAGLAAAVGVTSMGGHGLHCSSYILTTLNYKGNKIRTHNRKTVYHIHLCAV